MAQIHQANSEKHKLKFGFLQIPPALKSANVCCFVIGESVSFFGSWMTQFALVWMIYQLTNSAVLVGIAGFTNQATGLVLTPIVGVLLDRWNLRYVLLATQLVSIILSGALTYLSLTGEINFIWILVIGILQGIVKAFDLPARLIAIPRIVDNKADTYSAISIHSFLINTAKFISPMVGGLLLAKVGAASCFLVDSVSYFPFISAILTVRIKSFANNDSTKKPHIWQNLKEGFVYTYEFLPIKYVLMMQVIICFMIMTYVNLMPIFTTDILNGNAETMGYIMTASALGSIVAGLFLILRRKVTGLEKVVANSTLILGLSLIFFSRSANLELCLILIFIVGMTNTLSLIAISNFIQLIIVDENKRGRVTSIFTTGFLGILPFGNLFFGGLAGHIGVANALLFGGVCCSLSALYFARKLPEIKKIVCPIYKQTGLISTSN